VIGRSLFLIEESPSSNGKGAS